MICYSLLANESKRGREGEHGRTNEKVKEVFLVTFWHQPRHGMARGYGALQGGVGAAVRGPMAGGPVWLSTDGEKFPGLVMNLAMNPDWPMWRGLGRVWLLVSLMV